jgi:hypothetical protein
MEEFTASLSHISAIVLLWNRSKEHVDVLYTHKSSMLPNMAKNNNSCTRSRIGRGHDEQRCGNHNTNVAGFS